MRDFLRELAVAAAEEVTEGASCGISVVVDGRVEPLASSDARAARLEAYAGEIDAPHHLAIERDAPMHIADLRLCPDWRGFLERAREEQVLSLVVQPIHIDDEPSMGLLALYSDHTEIGEGTHRGHVLTRLAQEVGRAAGLAVRLSATERDVWHLQNAMSSRAVIDHAIGIIMGQNRCGADEAFDVLSRASQRENRKLRLVARDLVERVSGREAVIEQFQPTKPGVRLDPAE